MKYLILILLAVPQFASAQRLIQCEGAADCNFCSLVATFHNLISLLMTIVVFFCVLLFIYTGFKLVTSGGNPSAKDEAKKLFTNTVIGFLIVLCSWTVVDVILKALVTNAEVGVWHTIDPSNCGSDRTAGTPGGGVTGGGGGGVSDVVPGVSPGDRFTYNEPAIPEHGIEAHPNHGHPVELIEARFRSGSARYSVRDLTNGQQMNVGCQLLLPQPTVCSR